MAFGGLLLLAQGDIQSMGIWLVGLGIAFIAVVMLFLALLLVVPYMYFSRRAEAHQ